MFSSCADGMMSSLHTYLMSHMQPEIVAQCGQVDHQGAVIVPVPTWPFCVCEIQHMQIFCCQACRPNPTLRGAQGEA